MNTAQKLDFIERSRNIASALLDFEELQEQYTAQDLGNTLVDGDFTNENDGITLANLTSLYGTPWTDVNALLVKAGIKTVLYTIASTNN